MLFPGLGWFEGGPRTPVSATPCVTGADVEETEWRVRKRAARPRASADHQMRLAEGDRLRHRCDRRAALPLRYDLKEIDDR